MIGEENERMLKWFKFLHISDAEMRAVTMLFAQLAVDITLKIPAGPERTVALRKLLEAKDCAERAILEGRAAKVASLARAAQAASIGRIEEASDGQST